MRRAACAALVLVAAACGSSPRRAADAPSGDGPAPVSAHFPKADALRVRADGLPVEKAEEAAALYLEARAELFREWIKKHERMALDAGKALAGAVEKGWYQELEPEAREVLWRTQVGRGEALRRLRRFRELLLELPLAYPDGKDCPRDMGDACARHLATLVESFPNLVRNERGAFDIAIAATVPEGEAGGKVLAALPERVQRLKLTTLAFEMTVDRVEGDRRRVLVREAGGHSLKVPLAASDRAPVQPGDHVLVVADLASGTDGDGDGDGDRVALENGVVVYGKTGARFRYLYGVDLGWLTDAPAADAAE